MAIIFNSGAENLAGLTFNKLHTELIQIQFPAIDSSLQDKIITHLRTVRFADDPNITNGRIFRPPSRASYKENNFMSLIAELAAQGVPPEENPYLGAFAKIEEGVSMYLKAKTGFDISWQPS